VSWVEIMALHGPCVLSCTIVLLRTISDNNAELEFTVQCGFMLDRYGPVLCSSLEQTRLENLLVTELIKKPSGLWNLKVHYRSHNRTPLLPLLR